MASEKLCSSCSNSIYCPTWAEWKCTKQGIRFTAYGYSMPTKCNDYVKRPSNWKEISCGCDSCQRNESLVNDLDEET